MLVWHEDDGDDDDDDWLKEVNYKATLNNEKSLWHTLAFLVWLLHKCNLMGDDQAGLDEACLELNDNLLGWRILSFATLVKLNLVDPAI